MRTRAATYATIRITDAVTFVEGPLSNWVVLAQSDGIALIDAGYPGDTEAVRSSIRASGFDPRELRRVYVTHGHADHIGSIPDLVAADPTLEILADSRELRNVRGPTRQQVTVRDIGINLLRPRVVDWAVRAVRAGGMLPLEVPTARSFETQDFTRGDVVPRPAPGHTSGSTVFILPGAGAMATGDAIVTAHRTTGSRRPRPRLLPEFFSHDRSAESLTAASIALPELILPGHDPALQRTGCAWAPLVARVARRA